VSEPTHITRRDFPACMRGRHWKRRRSVRDGSTACLQYARLSYMWSPADGWRMALQTVTAVQYAMANAFMCQCDCVQVDELSSGLTKPATAK